MGEGGRELVLVPVRCLWYYILIFTMCIYYSDIYMYINTYTYV